MKKMKKRILSAIMAIAMMLSVMPVLPQVIAGAEGEATPNPTITANNLTFTGEAQPLITVAHGNEAEAYEADPYTLQYSLDNESWQTAIPAAADVGEYAVYIKTDGNSSFEAKTFDPVRVQINYQTINLGDYMYTGAYYGGRIKWRCVAFEKVTGYDENGDPIIDSTQTSTTMQPGYLPLMLADGGLDYVAPDAKTSDNSTTGSHSRSYSSGTIRTRRDLYGSNYWGDSNIRDWLNSTASAGNVVWTDGNPPDAEHTVYGQWYGYADRAGFLTNFVRSESYAIKTVAQKSILAWADRELATSGTTYLADPSGFGNASNYSTAWSEMITDSMFYIDVQQAANIYNNSTALGGNYLLSYPTDAMHNHWGTTMTVKNMGLRTPNVGQSNSYVSVSGVKTNGTHFLQIWQTQGVANLQTNTMTLLRPAFFLDNASAQFKNGTGSSDDPYRYWDDPTAKTTLKYTGSPQKLMNEDGNTYGEGTLMYSLTGEDGSWSEDIPEGTSVGEYSVYYKVQGNGNHAEVISPVTVTIAKGEPVVTAPTGLNLAVTGFNQTLVTAGGAEGGQMMYSLDGATWQTTLPQASAVNTYTVYYYVKGDDNHNDSAVVTVEAAISKRVPSPVLTPLSRDYDGASKPLISVEYEEDYGDYGTYELLYKVGDGEWSAAIPQAVNGGAYTVYVKTDGNSIYEAKEFDPITVNINKLTPVVAVTPYNSTFNNTQKTLATGTTSHGTLEYSADGGSTWSGDNPKAVDAGTYTIKYRVQGNENMNEVTGEVTSVISPYAPSLNVAPIHKVYDGEETTLVTYTAPLFGTLEFSENNADWSQTAPKKTNAGSYDVWYRFTGNNVSEIAATKVTAEIDKLTPVITYDYDALIWYDGDEHELIRNPQTTAGTIQYSTDDGATWSTAVPKASTKGTYIVMLRVPEETNVKASGVITVRVVIDEADPRIKLTPNTPLIYNGQDQQLIKEVELTVKNPSPATEANPPQLIYMVKQPGDDAFAVPTADDDARWSTERPTGKNAGTYTLYYKVKKQESLYTEDIFSVDILIEKAKAPTSVPDIDTTYGTTLGQIKDNLPENVTFKDADETSTGNVGENRFVVHYKNESDPDNYEEKDLVVIVKVTQGQTDKPDISIDYEKELLIGFDPNEQYTIDGDALADHSSTSQLVDADMTNTDKAIVLKGDANHADSNAQNVTIPERPDAPTESAFTVAQPAFVSAVGRIGGITNTMEYSIDGGNSWIKSDGAEITAQQGDTVKVRVAASNVNENFHSDAYDITIEEFSVAKETAPKAADLGIDFIKETITGFEPNERYIIIDEDGEEYIVVADKDGEVPIDEEWFSDELEIKKMGDILYTQDSDPITKEIPPRPAPPDAKGGEGEIYDIDDTMEYRGKQAAEYTDVPDGKTSVPEKAGDYEVRIEATETSFASLPTPVTVTTKKNPTPQPQVEKPYITNLEPNTDYEITTPDGTKKTVTTDEQGRTPIDPDWIGKTIQIVEKGDGEFTSDSDPAEVTIPRDAPDVDTEGKQIIKVDDTMEYRPVGSGDDDWVSVPAGEIKTPELPDGKYEVRYKQDGDIPPSDSTEVEIKIKEQRDAPDVDTEGKKIIKVDDTMEYHPVGSGDDDWVSVPAGQIQTPELPDGDYEVRYKATDDEDPSPSTTVTIKTATTRRGGGSSNRAATPTPSPTADPNGNESGNGNGNGSGDVPELIKDDHFAYVSGYEDDTFRPDTPIRRGEVAAIFARLISETMEEKGNYVPSFTDMTDDMYCYKQIGFLEQYGILSGYTDNTFRPWENITRAEFAVVASKFAKLTKTEENPFTDVPADFWGASYILLAHANGWISGYEDNTFRPAANITRAEVVSIVNRMLERVCDEDYLKEHAEDISVYKDITSSHWAYNDTIEASNGHEFVIDENDKETWTDLK